MLLAILFTLFVRAEQIDGIYATVNDEMMTYSDIDEYSRQLKSRLLYEDLLFSDDAVIESALKDKKILVDKLIGEKILDSEAKKLGINITEERVNKEIATKGGDKHLSSLLEPKGLTLSDYKKFLQKSLARKEVVNYYISSRVKISDEDILDFYASATKGAASGKGFEYDLSHILFPYRSNSEKEAARARAQEAYKSLRDGQSFASLHSKYNRDQKTDSFGVFKSGEMLPAIEGAIAPLKSGDTTAVVESPMGFHLFKLNNKRIVNNPDFEKRKQQIFQYLFTKNYKEQLDYWLSQRRRAAVVKINADKVASITPKATSEKK